LADAYYIGRRVRNRQEALPPHRLPLTMNGASLLWIGRCGFNAGSALAANAAAALALFNPLPATAAAVLAWSAVEWLSKGRSSLLGAASGAVAGLVGITPAAGLVGPVGALIIGAVTGAACVWGVNGLKRLLRADD